MDRDEMAAILGIAPEAVRIIPTAVRRRLRLQARPLGAALRRARGMASRPSRRHGLHAAGIHGDHHQAPSGAHAGRASAPTPGRPAYGHGFRRPTSTPAPMRPGGRRWPTACRSTPPAPMSLPAYRARSRAVPHEPACPPAPSAASACRRPRSRRSSCYDELADKLGIDRAGVPHRQCAHCVRRHRHRPGAGRRASASRAWRRSRAALARGAGASAVRSTPGRADR